MTDTIPTTPPIVVDSSAIPSGLMLGLRQVALAAGSYLIGRGYLSADTATAIGSVLLIVAPVVWGQVRSYLKKRQDVTIANAAPDSVAVVKR